MFETWCASMVLDPLPAAPATVGTYLASLTGRLPVLQIVQHLAEKPFGRRGGARRREVEIDRISPELGPLAADLDVSLVDAPTRRARPGRFSTAPR